MRFIKLLGLAMVAAGLFVSSASAGGFTDASYITPVGKVDAPYYHLVQWKPGTGCPPFKFSLGTGAFPPGLTLHSTGVIDGTPTQEGTFVFYIEKTDQCGGYQEGNSAFTIVISGHKLRANNVAGNTLPDAMKGTNYSPVTLTARGGSGAYTWSIIGSSALPAGLALSSSGVISGNATTDGAYTFQVQVMSADGDTDSTTVHLKVVDPLGLTVSAGIAEVGRPFTSTLQGSGGASGFTYGSVAGLPAGLTFDGAQTIHGTPTASGAAHVTVNVTDADHNSATLTVTVRVVARLTISTTRLIGATKGHAYSARLRRSGGVRPLSWRLSGGRLPGGIRLNTSTGALAGRARAAGTFHFRVTVTDGLGATSTRALTITIH